MGFFERTKLSGEIMMIDREILARKKLFGVELYDLMHGIERDSKEAFFQTPGILKDVEYQIMEPLEHCRTEVKGWALEKEEKEAELEILQVRREKDTKGGLGKWMSNTGTDAKLKMDVTLLERKMKIRKEQFGVEIWPTISQPSSITGNVVAQTKKKAGVSKIAGALGGLAKGVTTTASSALGKLSGDERKIQECVDTAKKDVAAMERSKEIKQSLIDGDK